jgi:4-amino-4-deoxy-L-arabinose transferase-like glycosyltransferase
MKGILLAAFLLRLILLIATPFDDRHSNLGINGFNDEMSHIHYVRYLAERRALPVQTRSVLDADAFEANEFEYYQPPLYYALAAPAYAAAEKAFPGKGAYAIRLVSLVFGLLTVAAAGWAGSAFDRRMGILCATLFAVFPGAAFFTAIAGNDSLAWLVGAIWLGALLHAPEKPRFPRQAGLGLLLGLGMLAKSSLLSLMPLVFLKPWLAWRRTGDWRRLLPPVSVCLIAFAVMLPYYLRNLKLYGSFLALDIGAGAQPGFLLSPSWHRIYAFISWTVVTFWDPFNVPLGFHNFPVKVLLVSLTGSYGGMLIVGWLRLPLRRVRDDGARDNLLLAWAAVGLSCAGYLWYNLRFPQSDARLMFHALGALFIVSIHAGRSLTGLGRPQVGRRGVPGCGEPSLRSVLTMSEEP